MLNNTCWPAELEVSKSVHFFGITLYIHEKPDMDHWTRKRHIRARGHIAVAYPFLRSSFYLMKSAEQLSFAQKLLWNKPSILAANIQLQQHSGFFSLTVFPSDWLESPTFPWHHHLSWTPLLLRVTFSKESFWKLLIYKSWKKARNVWWFSNSV